MGDSFQKSMESMMKQMMPGAGMQDMLAKTLGSGEAPTDRA